MVLTDISQLSAECKDWRQILRNYKEEFCDCRSALQDMCKRNLTKEQLPEIEHFENQFHIQLINIHDLKHLIKAHEQLVTDEIKSGEHISDEIFAYHEGLLDRFLSLENTLQELRNDFKNFINAGSC
jgi:DNA-binding GntR family transcriptional regulator